MRQPPLKLAVLVSGNGSNLQSIIDHITQKKLNLATLAVVISNRKSAYALERAKIHNIPMHILLPSAFATPLDYDKALLKILNSYHVDLVVLAGYLKLCSSLFVKAYPKRILNIHPSLLPQFPGLHSIEKAHQSGLKKTGVTVHFVDEGMDTGDIILQESLDIQEGESLESLTNRIHSIEHKLYPRAIQKVIQEIMQ